MDKMREEFEAWFSKEKGDKVHENYQFLTKEIMYEGWKASRAALCVELPVWTLKNGADYFNYHKADDVKAACEESGVSYK